jgi:hypothetical protein
MTTHLNYYKTILKKISFDSYLFHKEYHKAIRDLTAQEMDDLNKWIQSTGLDNILADKPNIQLMHDNEMQ